MKIIIRGENLNTNDLIINFFIYVCILGLITKNCIAQGNNQNDLDVITTSIRKGVGPEPKAYPSLGFFLLRKSEIEA